MKMNLDLDEMLDGFTRAGMKKFVKKLLAASEEEEREMLKSLDKRAASAEKESNDLAAGNHKVNSVQRRDVSELLDQALGFNGVISHNGERYARGLSGLRGGSPVENLHVEAGFPQGFQDPIALLGAPGLHLDVDADVTDRYARIGAVVEDVHNVRLVLLENVE